VTAELRSAVPFDEDREEEAREDAASDDRLLEDVDFFVDLDRDDEDVDPVDRDDERDRPPEPLPCPLAAAIPLPTQRAHTRVDCSRSKRGAQPLCD
jgi:hypothetical protein